MGFDYATFSDHVVIPTDIQAKYPYSRRGEFPAGARAERHEQLIEVAFVAAKTTHAAARHLGDGGAAPPGGADGQDARDHRRAVGRPADPRHRRRLAEGGVRGASRRRISPRAARSPTNTSWPSRSCGPRTSRASPASMSASTTSCFEPKPVQKPHPPIWVGGESGPALRRTAQLGDAWYPIGTNPAFPLDSLARFKASVARLRKMTAEAGRDPDAVGSRCAARATARACRPRRATASGGCSPASRRRSPPTSRRCATWASASLDIGFGGTTVEAMLAEMQKFRKDVLSLV